MNPASRSLRARLGLALTLACLASVAQAQTVDTTPSRKTLEEAAGENCDGVSGVVRRCAQQAKDADAKASDRRSDDPLVRSRAATKEGFDRQDRRGRDDALSGTPAESTGDSGGAQKLGGVSVTGKADRDLTPEEILQRNLAPPPPPAKSGTVSKYLADGARYECIEKCVGPACCVPLNNLPNPARDSNGIGR